MAKSVTLMLLGSGGHTSELLSLVSGMDFRNKYEAHFLFCQSDSLSQQRLVQSGLPFDSLQQVFRARNVGQSWMTTPLTFLITSLQAAWICFRLKPQLVICNGTRYLCPFLLFGRLLVTQKPFLWRAFVASTTFFIGRWRVCWLTGLGAVVTISQFAPKDYE